MRAPTTTLALAFTLTAPAVAADEAKKPPAPARIAALVRQLGDDKYERREAAARALTQAGPAALGALRGAMASDDPEARRRAAAISKAIQTHALARALKALQGDWSLCGNHLNGKDGIVLAAKGLPARFEVGETVTFRHPTISYTTFAVAGAESSGGSGTIEFVEGGETIRCRYQIKGGRLSLTWPLRQPNGKWASTAVLPKGLKTKPGDSFHVLTFVRPQPAGPSPEPAAPGRAAASPMSAASRLTSPLGPAPGLLPRPGAVKP